MLSVKDPKCPQVTKQKNHVHIEIKKENEKKKKGMEDLSVSF